MRNNQEAELIKFIYFALWPFIFVLLILSSGAFHESFWGGLDLDKYAKIGDAIGGVVGTVITLYMIFLLYRQNQIAQKELDSIQIQLEFTKEQLTENIKNYNEASKREIIGYLFDEFEKNMEKVKFDSGGLNSNVSRGKEAIREAIKFLEKYENNPRAVPLNAKIDSVDLVQSYKNFVPVLRNVIESEDTLLKSFAFFRFDDLILNTTFLLNKVRKFNKDTVLIKSLRYCLENYDNFEDDMEFIIMLDRSDYLLFKKSL